MAAAMAACSFSLNENSTAEQSGELRPVRGLVLINAMPFVSAGPSWQLIHPL